MDQDTLGTPFRVIDDGFAFLIELIIRTYKEGEDDVFYFVPRVIAFETVCQIGPLPEPRPWGWDQVEGPMVEIVYRKGIAEYYRADPEEVQRAWLQFRKKQRRNAIFSNQ